MWWPSCRGARQNKKSNKQNELNKKQIVQQHLDSALPCQAILDVGFAWSNWRVGTI